MSQKQGSSKKSRTHKESKGINRGAKREKAPMLLLIAMNKGMAHKSKRKSKMI